MQKWIQFAEKPLEHLDYTDLTTQVCRSNNILPDFGQISPENMPGKGKKRSTFRLWLGKIFL